MHNTILIGAPIDEGQRRAGCVMGPTAYRVAGIAAAISDCGHGVNDWGDVALPACPRQAAQTLRCMICARFWAGSKCWLPKWKRRWILAACRSFWAEITVLRWGRWRGLRRMRPSKTDRCFCCGWMRIRISTRH